jgi:hypothetical protein
MLSSGRRGLLDYAALYGSLPSREIISAFFSSHESLSFHNGPISRRLFDSSVAGLGDYMAIADLELGKFDTLLKTKLERVFGTTPIDGDAVNNETTLTLQQPYQSRLQASVINRAGLHGVVRFYVRHLRKRTLDKAWTWAEVAHVMLIMESSLHTDLRLYRQYGSRLSLSARTSLAGEQLQKATMVEGMDATIAERLVLWRALDTTLMV